MRADAQVYNVAIRIARLCATDLIDIVVIVLDPFLVNPSAGWWEGCRQDQCLI